MREPLFVRAEIMCLECFWFYSTPHIPFTPFSSGKKSVMNLFLPISKDETMELSKYLVEINEWSKPCAK